MAKTNAKNQNIETSTKTNINETYLKNDVKTNDVSTIDEKTSIDVIVKNDKLRNETIDKLLLQLSNESTSKIDKKSIRRFLRQLNHRNGLRNTKYSKSKTLFDYIK